jgi:hypothetical protein
MCEFQCFEMGNSRPLFLSCTDACGRRGKLGCCGEARHVKASIHAGADVVCTYGSRNSQGVEGLLLKAWRRRGMWSLKEEPFPVVQISAAEF